MAKKVRVSEYTDLIEFYEQKVIFDEESCMNVNEYVPAFKKWARVKVIFREQLESLLSGGNTLRDRIELTIRYTRDVNTTMKFKYRDNLYAISIIGDKNGLKQEISLLGEAVLDGGE
ncbi:phage head closure protein [Carnobacteriaceae bacterium zg-ZUI252]|nr:phage head closure protein [Carnobacteriaceae bacterium zg-ZUI252]